MRAVTAKPRNCDWVQSAALPLAGLTAYQAVVKTLRVAEGDTLLVHGAAGAVGSLATQIALALGARVIGTASAPNFDYPTALGAQPLPRGDDLTERVRAVAPAGVDAILHTAGGNALEAVVALVERGVVQIRIGRTLPLTDAATAHRLQGSGHGNGKIVLTVD